MAGKSIRQRGWIWAGVALGIFARSLGAGALFWAVFPLWLSVFWSVQGYPPTLSDLPRWYVVGAFNAAPILAATLGCPVAFVGAFLGSRLLRRSYAAPLRAKILLYAFLYALLVPPAAYALLLMYTDMWQYRAWDVMTPTLLRAYLLLAPACGMVGAVIGWSFKK